MNITCNNINVDFSGFPGSSEYLWDFGDGDTAITNTNKVNHVYVDVNPYLNPITARYSRDGGTTWLNEPVDLPGILVGTGCGSVRSISQLLSSGVLPANGIVGQNMYVFGDLEVNTSYIFDDCDLYEISGGKIVIQSGALLTLKNSTHVDAHIVIGDVNCQDLWKGIEVNSGGHLETGTATLKNAYFAISPVQDNGALPVPKLSLYGTTFERCFVDIYAAQGKFILSKFTNNSFNGANDDELYLASTCTTLPTIPGVAFARRTFCGIYFNGGGTSFAALSVPLNSANNVFKDMQAGIVGIDGTVNIRNCRFENIQKLSGNTAAYQATAITFLDNVGGKRLNVVGLGMNGASTVHHTERGIYALTSKAMTQVGVQGCRMTEIQNGVALDEGAQGMMGNFSLVNITDNYLDCSYYPGNIQTTSTGIEVKDPSSLYTDIKIAGNEINLDQPEAFPTPTSSGNIAIQPTAIRFSTVPILTSPVSMGAQIAGNLIEMPKGLIGIEVINAAKADIYDNIITTDNDFVDGDHPLYGIRIEGGANNLAKCNHVIETNPPDPIVNTSNLRALSVDGSLNTSMDGNTTFNAVFGIQYTNDNATECLIASNDLQTFDEGGIIGLFYLNALTGPQYLTGNEWTDQFFLEGAAYLQGNTAYSYCNSLYTVSPSANIGPGSQNTVGQGSQENCNGTATDWFTVVNDDEQIYGCNASRPARTTTINDADLDLAGGGTSDLSAGFKWSTEMWLYQKFDDNPSLTANESIASTFLQNQSGQPIEQMNSVRKDAILSSAVSSSTATALSSLSTQLQVKDSLMAGALFSAPANWSAWSALSTEADSLAQLLSAALSQASGEVATQAAATILADSSINCTTQPCVYERYLHGLYLNTRVIAPRALTTTEVTALHDIAVQCPGEAGPAVYMARSWYYLLTGENLKDTCSSPAPSLLTEGRSSARQTQAVSIKVLPNPADQSVQILLPPRIAASTLLVRDMLGRVKVQQTVPPDQSDVNLSLSQLPNGCYAVIALDESGKPLSVARLIVAH